MQMSVRMPLHCVGGVALAGGPHASAFAWHRTIRGDYNAKGENAHDVDGVRTLCLHTLQIQEKCSLFTL